MKSAWFNQTLVGFGYVLVFVLVFALTCGVIRAVLPFPQVPVVQVKVNHLANHIDDYDTLFIGSSRIYRHVVPLVFDQLMAQAGNTTRSFNAGVDGMRPPEDAYVLDQILSFKPKNLRYIFVELGGLRVNLDADKEGTIRSVYWHDWERLQILFRRALYQKKKKRDYLSTLKSLREPMALFADHLTLFAQKMSNIGRGEIIGDLLRGRRPGLSESASIGTREDGYVAANIPDEMPPAVRLDYERSLEERRQKPAATDLGDPISQEALERMVAKIEGVGAMPILIVPPTTSRKNFVPGSELASRVLVFDFSDIDRYPALYENRHRQDSHHVNAAGAEVFTSILAREFAPHITGK